MSDLTGATWRKSTRSNNGGECVEIADNLASVVGLRDSKDPIGPVLAFAPAQWSIFVAAIKTNVLAR